MKRLSLLLLGLFAAFAAQAEPPARPVEDRRGVFTFSFENDIFTGQDNGYTNGVRAAWMSSESGVPEWVSNTADHLPFVDPASHKRMGIAFGQNIYTPEDKTLRNPSPQDRPYAGWLYGSLGVVADTGKVLDTYQLTLGIVGPHSYAQQTQTLVHKMFDVPVPKGWHAQLRDEPGVVLTYDRKWRSAYRYGVYGLSGDVMPQVGVNLGNVYTNATTGLIFRFGQNLPEDYGPPLIQPSLTGSDFFIPTEKLGWYVFGGVSGQAVARNIFLDGNTWRDSASVDKLPLVGGVQAGIAFTYGRSRLAYTYALRSKEFHGQESGDQYGAVTLSYRF